MGLLEADCPPQFLEFFCVEGSRPEERQAFEEFLFGLTHDELTRVRAAMQKAGRAVVDTAFVAGVLDRPVEEAAAMDDPDALFRSYRRRRTGAQFRRLTGAAGPVRVAESYLMICLLLR
jgi:hypothetical protein